MLILSQLFGCIFSSTFSIPMQGYACSLHIFLVDDTQATYMYGIVLLSTSCFSAYSYKRWRYFVFPVTIVMREDSLQYFFCCGKLIVLEYLSFFFCFCNICLNALHIRVACIGKIWRDTFKKFYTDRNIETADCNYLKNI